MKKLPIALGSVFTAASIGYAVISYGLIGRVQDIIAGKKTIAAHIADIQENFKRNTPGYTVLPLAAVGASYALTGAPIRFRHRTRRTKKGKKVR